MFLATSIILDVIQSVLRGSEQILKEEKSFCENVHRFWD